ncbi:membrane protein DedA with SNARE-associated domain [Sphingomonas jejuensis]|uniref:Membrane protein DedA with SNARE-associated domain n=1 Tax=Sphingomonas jejuensis TaxID=904715 RepID=A0ABX0XIC9_9SPHN|nr:DedA family protein [Sphingomonas jejuensis]NJC32985.1 membrane protein DedA with SNARE-associated domain [Sphingomonas jejuensis]
MSDWIVDLINRTGYLGVAFLMFLETVFPPIPSEVIMPVAGVQAAQGTLNLWGVIASGTGGAMLGNMFWYFAARSVGIARFKPFIDRWGRWLTIDWHEIERAQKLFGHYGSAFVFIARMLPTVRSLISIPAGFLKLRLSSFIIWSTLGTAIWTGALTGAGWWLGQRFENRIDDFVGPISNAVIALILASYLWRLIFWRPAPKESATDQARG